jgi:hypothetical protein
VSLIAVEFPGFVIADYAILVPQRFPSIAEGITNAETKINHSGSCLNRCKKLSW